MRFTQYISLNRNLNIWLFLSKLEKLESFLSFRENRLKSLPAVFLLYWFCFPPFYQFLPMWRRKGISCVPCKWTFARSSFSWKVSSLYLFIYLYFFSFTSFLSMLSLYLKETFKTFENITCWVGPWMIFYGNCWSHVFILGYMWNISKSLHRKKKVRDEW